MQLVEPRPHRRLPIRMTPLIDVVFILLVFFMVTSRLSPTSHLDLNNTTSNADGSRGDPVPELLMHADGRIEWAGRSRTAAETARALVAEGRTNVNIETLHTVPLGTFTEGLTHLQSAGIETHWRRTATPGPSNVHSP